MLPTPIITDLARALFEGKCYCTPEETAVWAATERGQDILARIAAYKRAKGYPED